MVFPPRLTLAGDLLLLLFGGLVVVLPPRAGCVGGASSFPSSSSSSSSYARIERDGVLVVELVFKNRESRDVVFCVCAFFLSVPKSDF